VLELTGFHETNVVHQQMVRDHILQSSLRKIKENVVKLTIQNHSDTFMFNTFGHDEEKNIPTKLKPAHFLVSYNL